MAIATWRRVSRADATASCQYHVRSCAELLMLKFNLLASADRKPTSASRLAPLFCFEVLLERGL
jgi:hypothetical protein